MRNLRKMPPLRRLMFLGAMANAAGKLIEDTATGNPLKFLTDVSKPLKSLLIPFTPKQSGTGDPSPDNIRPITGWTGVNVFHAGKNLLNAIQSNAINYGSYGHYTLDNGVMTVDGGVLMGFKVQCKPSAKYTFSINPSKLAYELHLRVYAFENEPTTYDTSKNRLNVRNSTSGSFTTQSTDNWLLVGVYVESTLGSTGLTISDFMLEVGETATAYEPYVSPSVYPVTWSSEGTVYGGTLDVVSGVLTVTHAFLTKNTANMNNEADYPGWKNSGVRALIGEGLSGERDGVLNIGTKFSINTKNNNDVLFLSKGTYNKTQDEWIALAIDVQVAVPLATPQTVQLTAEQITAIKGNNTLWSDADGSLTAVYLKKA